MIIPGISPIKIMHRRVQYQVESGKIQNLTTQCFDPSSTNVEDKFSHLLDVVREETLIFENHRNNVLEDKDSVLLRSENCLSFPTVPSISLMATMPNI